MLTKHCYNCKNYELIASQKKTKQVEWCNLLGRSLQWSVALNDELHIVPIHTGQQMLKEGGIIYGSEAIYCPHFSTLTGGQS